MDAIFDEEVPRARLGVLLKHFSQIDDDREPWRVMYPLAEVLFKRVGRSPLALFYRIRVARHEERHQPKRGEGRARDEGR